MKPFYLILTLIPALLIGRTVSAQISVDEVDAGEESVTIQDKLKSIPVDVDYISRARYKAARAFGGDLPAPCFHQESFHHRNHVQCQAWL